MPLGYVVVTYNWSEHLGMNPLTALWACCVIGETVTFLLMAGAIGAHHTASPGPYNSAFGLAAVLRLALAIGATQCCRTGQPSQKKPLKARGWARTRRRTMMHSIRKVRAKSRRPSSSNEGGDTSG